MISDFEKSMIKSQWKELSRKFPLICGLKTLNAELTIYSVLSQAYHQFDFIVITDDGSSDRTKEEITRCINDFEIRNVAFVDASQLNPWDDKKVEKREGDHHVPRPGGKTHAKAQWKSYEFVKKNFPNSIYVSLEDDVILENNIRWRIYDRISKWDDPFTDCEFFNVTSAINEDYVLLGCLKDGSPLPGIVQRNLFNNGGDWTFSAIWTGSDLSIGPDPLYPFGACIYPWMAKNQTGKKGQDGEKSFGFHMINYRTSKIDYEYDANVPGVKKIEELVDKLDESDWSLLKKVGPNKISLVLRGDKFVQEKKW
jgi:glycosyltransferase involved in cell wall biosynthesis